jgi:hypothetical protein
MDFPAFNVQYPSNENRSYRLNTALRATVEIAGDQPAQATNDESSGNIKHLTCQDNIAIMSADYVDNVKRFVRAVNCRSIFLVVQWMRTTKPKAYPMSKTHRPV